MKKLLNKEVLILIGLSVVFAIIYAFLHEKFILEFINGLTLAGIAVIVYGLLFFSWAKGNFAFMSWKPNKRVRTRAPGEVIPDAEKKPNENMSYRQYREYLSKQRSSMVNHALIAGIIVTVAAFILSVVYYVI